MKMDERGWKWMKFLQIADNLRKSSTYINNFVDNWKHANISAFDNFSDYFFQNLKNYRKNSKSMSINAIFAKLNV